MAAWLGYLTEGRVELHMSLSSAHEQQVRSGVGAVREAGMFREAMRPSVRMAPSPDIALRLM